MSISYDFSGRRVVVTGGASGIGKATVSMFAKVGATVFLLDVDSRKGEELAQEFPANVRYIHTDVSDTRSVNRAATSAGDPVDIIVNNAGIEYNDRGDLITMPEDLLKGILDVNLMGYIRIVRAFVPEMKEGGRIVNVSSIQGIAAHLPGTSYQASKAGILGLTRALAIELAPRITVNAVLPGAISTEGMGAVRAGDSAILDPYRRRIPLGRRGHSSEVAEMILFLASRNASYITGAEFLVDGGYSIGITPDNSGTPTPRLPNDPD